MATHKFDDIIPPSRRRESEAPSSKYSSKEASRSSRRPSRFPYLTILMVVVIVAASVGALIHFSSARVEIVPSTMSATVEGPFTASQSTGELPFKVVTAEKIASQSVQGGAAKPVSSSASGIITIYNTQSKPQTLVTNTRFATAAGLIFRIRSAVTVPGGTSAKPGSIRAKVYADKPGASYNLGPSSFTVPGFAGTPQATAIYARSTEAITGGASGTVPSVEATVEGPARRALMTALAPDLAKSLQDQVPAGYVLLAGAATTTYQSLESVPSATSGMVDIKEQGTITAVVFPNAALAKAIATAANGAGYQGAPVTLASTEGLTLSALSLPSAEASTFSFTLSGSAPLVYTVDTSRIAAAVAGKTRQAAEVALTNYPEIGRAIIVLRPFWKQTFPEDPASISVVLSDPR